MQIYIDQNGIQQSTSGTISVDTDTGEPAHKIVWDTKKDGGTIDPAKVGGYSRVDGELVFSQEAFDANETRKSELQATETAARTLASRAEAKAVLDGIQQNGIVQRAFAAVILGMVNASNAALAQLKTAESLSAWQAAVTIPPQKTPAQVIQAIKTLIDSGQVDGE